MIACTTLSKVTTTGRIN